MLHPIPSPISYKAFSFSLISFFRLCSIFRRYWYNLSSSSSSNDFHQISSPFQRYAVPAQLFLPSSVRLIRQDRLHSGSICLESRDRRHQTIHRTGNRRNIDKTTIRKFSLCHSTIFSERIQNSWLALPHRQSNFLKIRPQRCPPQCIDLKP